MKCAIVENNIIVNVIEISDTLAPEKFGGIPLPDGKWIGDEYDSDATQEQRIAKLESENKTLKAQVSAQSEQMDFYEECIAEIASVVYA